MKSIIAVILLGFALATHGQAKIPSFDRPPDTVSLLAPDQISTSLRERDFALSPDGLEMFYTLQAPVGGFQTIMTRRKDANGKWSKPVLASFAGNYTDLEPAFSPDGKKLFFSSNRPVEGESERGFDIWYVQKENAQWASPVNAGDIVNSAGDEFYPSIAANGNLYFTATLNNAASKEDIFVCVWKDGSYAPPVALDTAINTAAFEFNAFIAPDESYILFTSYGRAGDKGRGDIYMSRKNAYGQFEPSRRIMLLNSDRLDYCPLVSPDGKALFFTSERTDIKASFPGKPAILEDLSREYSGVLNGNGNIFWISFEKVLEAYAQSQP